MKDVTLVVICVIVLMLCGCAHNANMVGVGKVFRIGGEGCNILYVNGIFSFNGVKGNAESVIETNDNDAIGNPADVKSVRAIRFRTLPQVNGYLVELAEKDPEAAKKFVEIMSKFNKAVWGVTPQEPAKESSTIAKAIDLGKLKEAAASTLKELKGDKASTTIAGDGEYTELYKDNTIEAQAALTAELLKFANDTAKMEGTGETLKDTLVGYAGRLAQLKAKGVKEAKTITLGRATIKDGKLTALMYRCREDDGTYRDEECPTCFPLED